MTLELLGAVHAESPATGAAFQLHCTMAYLANDDHRLRRSQADIAEYARMHRTTVRAQLAVLLDLRVLNPLKVTRPQTFEVFAAVPTDERMAGSRPSMAESRSESRRSMAGSRPDGLAHTRAVLFQTTEGGSFTQPSVAKRARDVDVNDETARALATGLWDRCKIERVPTPVVSGRGNPFMAVAGVARSFLEAGYDESVVADALWRTHRSAPITCNTVTFQLRRSGSTVDDDTMDRIARRFGVQR